MSSKLHEINSINIVDKDNENKKDHEREMAALYDTLPKDSEYDLKAVFENKEHSITIKKVGKK